MNTYPLIRVKWTNEHLMAGAFGVTLLYMVPAFIQHPGEAAAFLAVLAVSLFVDTVCNFLRHKRPICAVSASMTAGVFFILAPGMPLWARLIGAVAALTLGKHIWGGVGKNPINPALVGVVLSSLVFQIQPPIFQANWLLFPAMALSLPFVFLRPYAALSFMAGMAGSLMLKGSLDLESLVLIVFLGSLVLTDPVTLSAHPWVGLLGGAAAGFFSQQLSGSILFISVAILLLNLLSVLIERRVSGAVLKLPRSNRLNKLLPLPDSLPYFDLTEERPDDGAYSRDFSSVGCDEILKRIEEAGVFGLGGAAFPTIQKLRAVMSFKGSKHLIINGVECDPGLVHDYWLLRHSMKEVLSGVALLKECISFNSISLAVKNEEGLPHLDKITLVRVPDCYPIGAERLLISEVLGKNISLHTPPAQEGILVLNAGTLAALHEAVIKRKKSITRLMTVADLKTKTLSVVKVTLGMSLNAIAEAVRLSPGTLFTGGGAMQCRLVMDEDIVESTTNFLAVGHFPRYKESPLCSRCGSCSAHCPSGIKVDKIADLVDREKWEEIPRYHPENCIQCGYCSHVCLAGRNLSAKVKRAKAQGSKK